MKPTDDTIALCAFLKGATWHYGDELAGAVAHLGFEKPSNQYMVGRLVAMCKESAPRFERRLIGGINQYRVTSFAATGLGNQWWGFDRLRRLDQELPTPKPEHLRDSEQRDRD